VNLTMTTIANILRTAFPAAMIVVCSSAYFIYWDRDPVHPDSNLASAPTTLDAKQDADKGEPTKSAIKQVAPDDPNPEATMMATTVVATEPVGFPVLPTQVLESHELELPLPALGLELGNRRQEVDEPKSESPPTAPNFVPVVDLPTEQPGGVSPPHFNNTRVNDYWVGLDRARSNQTSGSADKSGVVVNPYQQAANMKAVKPVSASVSPSEDVEGASVIHQPTYFEPELVRTVAKSSSPPQAVAELPRKQTATPQVDQETGPARSDFHAAQPIQQLIHQPIQQRVMATSTPRIPPVSDHVRQRVVEHWEYGGSLARRNAIQLAKQEFFSGLSLLSEHADQDLPAAGHLQALREGFLALEEAGDFAATRELRQSDLGIIVQKHKTPLIRDGHFTTDSHSQARQAYLLYAKERIRTAVEQQPLAAELLYSMGKLHLATFEQTRSTDNLDMNRAATLFECALMSDPHHEKTCNELAVIQAKNNNWSLAKSLLQQAVRRQPQFLEAWQNLTKVHQRLGETDFARLAASQVEFLSQQQPDQGPVRMVSNTEFMATAAAMDGNNETSVQPTGGTSPLPTSSRFQNVTSSNR
jgi:tetratricopeptide (TPR) repeat protein